jgi:hypothetical protein
MCIGTIWLEKVKNSKMVEMLNTQKYWLWKSDYPLPNTKRANEWVVDYFVIGEIWSLVKNTKTSLHKWKFQNLNHKF